MNLQYLRGFFKVCQDNYVQHFHIMLESMVTEEREVLYFKENVCNKKSILIRACAVRLFWVIYD